jgi:predicted permease
MTILYRIRALVRWLFRRDEIERALETDMADYIERSAADKMRDGMSEAEARRAARIELGGVEQTKESVRTTLSFAPIDHTLADLKYAVRAMRRQKTFTAVTVLTVALGIGVNAGVFTVLNGVLFRDLPAPDAHELVSIQQTVEGGQIFASSGGVTFAAAEYRAYRDRVRTLSGVLAFANAPPTILGGDSPQSVEGTLVSCNYFAVLRQPPTVGRALGEQDCEPGADPVVLLAHEFWTARYGADPAIVGRSIELNRELFTVVGVAAEGTYAGDMGRSGFFAPIGTEPLLEGRDDSRYENDRYLWLYLIGRRSEASLAQVRAEIEVIAAQIDQEDPGRATRIAIERATPMTVPIIFRGIAIAVAAVLMAAFGFILLIACANVANLLLARGTTRTHEIAVRLSLGAGRSRVVRQLLTESLLISLAGGALGAVLGVWSLQALVGLALPTLLPGDAASELVLDLRPDWRVLSFAAALTLGTSVLFGLAPALEVSRPNLHALIKQDTAGAASSRRGGRLRAALVGTQVALCMALMIAAGLLLRGLYSTYTVDPGFDHRDVVAVSLEFGGGSNSGYDAAAITSLRQRLAEAVEALPDVAAVASATLAPLGTDEFFTVRARLPGAAEDDFRPVRLNYVTPGFFSLVGIPIVRGRSFADTDLGSAEADVRPVIVTETTARNFWPGTDPLGETLLRDGKTLRVVGIAADVQATALGHIDSYYLYEPIRDAGLLLIKSRTDFATTAATVRGIVRSLDPALPGVRIFPLEDNLAWWRGLSATVTTLGAGLGALALVLASVGIYGVVSYAVTRRYREIGIRMALGASARNALTMVLRRTMRPVIVGAAIGIAAAIALSSILSSVLFGVSPFDAVGLGGGALLVIGVALAAGVLAARHATRVDPTVALRYE